MILKILKWSGWRDSNSRHPGPKPGALPGYATPRERGIIQSEREKSIWAARCCRYLLPRQHQVIHHGPQGEDGGEIDQHRTDLAGGNTEQGFLIQEKQDCQHLKYGLDLAQHGDGNAFAVAQLRHPFAQGRNGQFAPDDDEGDDRIHVAELEQNDQRGDHHQLVRDRVEESAERRTLVQCARQITVQPVGDRGQPEDECAEQMFVVQAECFI